MARVMWSVRDTGEQGHGEWIEVPLAYAWAKHMNATCPSIDHWVELKPWAADRHGPHQ